MTQAPNRSVINLLGGNIYGNIDLQSNADAINVTTGETNFNGVINSFCMPAGGPTALPPGDDASGGLSNCGGVGTLTIGGGGNLHMLNVAADGPSYAFVNNFTVGANGTLTLDLPAATGGTAPVGTYPQIYSNAAFLTGGTLVANFAPPPNRLFDTTVLRRRDRYQYASRRVRAVHHERLAPGLAAGERRVLLRRCE